MDEIGQPSDDPSDIPPHHEAPEPARRRPGRLLLTLTLTPLVVLTVGNYVAAALLPELLSKHPAWLIGLNPITRNLILVSNRMSVTSYFILAVLRRMLPHPIWFLVGRWYGDAGVRWLEKRSPDIGAMVTTLEGWFPRFGWLICILYPHPLVCVLAGGSKMRFWTFNFYTLTGVVGFVWASRLFGKAVESPLKNFTDFIGHYSIPLTILSIVLVAFYLFNGQRGGKSKLESVGKMESELEAEARKDD